MRVSLVAIILLVIVLLAACGKADSARSPLAPTPVGQPTTPAAPTGSQIRGRVWDTAFRPLENATLVIIDGPAAGATTTSDATGWFVFTLSSIDDTGTVRAEKEGYITAVATPSRCPTCTFYNVGIRLSLPTPPVVLAREHTLTLVSDPACGGLLNGRLPDDVRTRTYNATLTAFTSPAYEPGTGFTVTLSGGQFVPRFNSFSIHVAGDYVSFNLDESEGPLVIEQVTEQTYLGFGGTGATTVPHGAASFTVPLTGTIDYCETAAPMTSAFVCLPQLVRAWCPSANHQLILTRR